MLKVKFATLGIFGGNIEICEMLESTAPVIEKFLIMSLRLFLKEFSRVFCTIVGK